jgi:hypothetical protein
MRTLVVDPVSAALLTTLGGCDCGATPWDHAEGCFATRPFLSFATVDRPPPDGACDCGVPWLDGGGYRHLPECASLGPSWIGQRVAIYAEDDGRSNDFYGDIRLSFDAIVGSGTLAEALPIMDGSEDDDWTVPMVLNDAGGLTHYGPLLVRVADIGDQLPLQDWSPGRWALRFTDVAPTSERCPDCSGRGAHDVDGDGNRTADGIWSKACPTCRRAGFCPAVVAPVLSGDDPIYREWRV